MFGWAVGFGLGSSGLVFSFGAYECRVVPSFYRSLMVGCHSPHVMVVLCVVCRWQIVA